MPVRGKRRAGAPRSAHTLTIIIPAAPSIASTRPRLPRGDAGCVGHEANRWTRPASRTTVHPALASSGCKSRGRTARRVTIQSEFVHEESALWTIQNSIAETFIA